MTRILLAAVSFILLFQTSSFADTKVLFTAETILRSNYERYIAHRWDEYLEEDETLYVSKMVFVEYENKNRRLYMNLYEIDKAMAAEKLGKEKAEAEDLLEFAKEKKAKTRYGNVITDAYSSSRGNAYRSRVKVFNKRFEFRVIKNRHGELSAYYEGVGLYDELLNPEVKDEGLWAATKPLQLEFATDLKKSDYKLIERVSKPFKDGDASLFFDHNVPKEIDSMDWGFELLSSDKRREIYGHFDNIHDFFEEKIDDFTHVGEANGGSYLFVRRPSDKKVVAIIGQFGIELGEFGDCGASAITPVGKKDFTLLEYDCD